MIGGGKDSAEGYHPISHPEKFAGLTELWRDGGDAIYEVPRRSRCLAHVMRLSDQVQPLRPWLRHYRDRTLPRGAGQSRVSRPRISSWRGPSARPCTADLKPDQILSVQITWDKGWNVYVGGRRVHGVGR